MQWVKWVIFGLSVALKLLKNYRKWAKEVPEALAAIRDVLNEVLGSLRGRMSSAEVQIINNNLLTAKREIEDVLYLVKDLMGYVEEQRP